MGKSGAAQACAPKAGGT